MPDASDDAFSLGCGRYRMRRVSSSIDRVRPVAEDRTFHHCASRSDLPCTMISDPSAVLTQLWPASIFTMSALLAQLIIHG